MIHPAGGAYSYEYDGRSLSRIGFPGGASRTYLYNEAASINGGSTCPFSPSHGPGLGGFAGLLTGITDENGVRFATWTYNCAGLVISSEHAGQVERYTFSYPGDRVGATSSTVVTDPRRLVAHLPVPNHARAAAQYGLERRPRPGVRPRRSDQRRQRQRRLEDRLERQPHRLYLRPRAQSRDLAHRGPDLRRRDHAADAHHHHAVALDVPAANGDRRAAAHHHLYLRRRRHDMRRARRALLEEHPGDHRRERLAGLLRHRGRLAAHLDLHLQRERLGAHRQRAAHRRLGRHHLHVLRRTTMPISASAATCATITNAAGHTTSITAYNAHGQPLTIVDPNGLTTTLTYDARQRLTRAGRRRTTTYDYDLAGQLTKVTLPDGSFLSYTYDDAHRLTGIAGQPRQPHRVHAGRDGQPHAGGGARSSERARADAQPRLQQPQPPVPGARRAEPDHRVRLRRPGQRRSR